MSRITLNDDVVCPDPVAIGGLILDDDILCGLVDSSTVAERLTVYGRSNVGRNEDGDSVYEWVALAESVPMIVQQQRTELVDDVTILRVKITTLLLDQQIDERAAISMNFGDASDVLQTNLFRVTSAVHSGSVTLFEAERQLDLS